MSRDNTGNIKGFVRKLKKLGKNLTVFGLIFCLAIINPILVSSSYAQESSDDRSDQALEIKMEQVESSLPEEEPEPEPTIEPENENKPEDGEDDQQEIEGSCLQPGDCLIEPTPTMVDELPSPTPTLADEEDCLTCDVCPGLDCPEADIDCDVAGCLGKDQNEDLPTTSMDTGDAEADAVVDNDINNTQVDLADCNPEDDACLIADSNSVVDSVATSSANTGDNSILNNLAAVSYTHLTLPTN